jgi:hypothetical protein
MPRPWAFCYEAPFVGDVLNRATSDEFRAVVGRKLESWPNLWSTAVGVGPGVEFLVKLHHIYNPPFFCTSENFGAQGKIPLTLGYN